MRATNSANDERSKQQTMLDVLGLFRVLVGSIRSHDKNVQELTGVGGSHLWALFYIGEHPGIKVGDLARALAIHQSTASNLIRDLERLGAIAKQRLDHDQRAVQLQVTPKGKGILQRAPRPVIGVLPQALQSLPVSDLNVLHQQLKQLARFTKPSDAKKKRVAFSKA